MSKASPAQRWNEQTPGRDFFAAWRSADVINYDGRLVVDVIIREANQQGSGSSRARGGEIHCQILYINGFIEADFKQYMLI
jgi:hypothetical protein